MSAMPATASFLLTFNSSWPKTECTSQITAFYRASGQTSSQRHREKVSFGMNAARCCQDEQTRAVQHAHANAGTKRAQQGGNLPPLQQTCFRGSLPPIFAIREGNLPSCMQKGKLSISHTDPISKPKAMPWLCTIATRPYPKGRAAT